MIVTDVTDEFPKGPQFGIAIRDISFCWTDISWHTKFGLSMLPGIGLKVCGGWVVCKPISDEALTQAEQYSYVVNCFSSFVK